MKNFVMLSLMCLTKYSRINYNINNSFPSGHATFIFSFSVSMWILFPKYRWLWALLAFLVVVTQLLQYFHFVSDLIVGLMLGSIIGYYAAQSYTKKSQTI
ncbi:hypothetical protein FTU_1497 [Francisella tularensis subsp. tularensis TIGB03]|nr:hypothetical protein NE061598_08265 [Francisella tularensis subsp. tularensis NE061598]AFB79505.1 hypothetical protein FTU_1497 [Francisella tularensis subsp. tularensis TIGB03]AFB81050.1 hypothetical protein FTV_1413 [Francisella tularensis subsp. tularensis TI0902]AKZ20461.1 hypothetical protein FTZ_1424 [Francisella tularensis subsp. tularensis MA00-2987]EKM85845.1 hypothetical protein B343_08428 [Francisella tularensis subsp. tularensis 80700075]EOA41589.1 hypothetical protein H647_0845